MDRLRLARIVCSALPPLVSQKVRNLIFPISEARRRNARFSRKSFTGSTFSGNMSDYHSYRMAVHGYFEWRNIVIASHFTRGQGDIVEIGANVGSETVSFCDVTSGSVHAFEPMPANINEMETLQKGLPNLKLYHNAISDREMTVQFKMPPATSSGTGKIVSAESAAPDDIIIDVQARPLDSFIDNFKDVRFMSIDTEGHEPFVLKSSLQVFDKFKPAVIIEVSPGLLRKYANSGSADIHAFFRNLGYKCYLIRPLSLEPITETHLQDKQAHNWLCIPAEKSGTMGKLQTKMRLRATIPGYLLPKLA